MRADPRAGIATTIVGSVPNLACVGAEPRRSPSLAAMEVSSHPANRYRTTDRARLPVAAQPHRSGTGRTTGAPESLQFEPIGRPSRAGAVRLRRNPPPCLIGAPPIGGRS
jgi:hypothetical protein